MKHKIEVAVGQRWAKQDDEGEYLYYSVVEVTDERVVYGQGQGSMPREKFAQEDWVFCGHDGPGILPPYSKGEYVPLGCGNSANPTIMPLSWTLDPGFGTTTVYRNGEYVWSGMETDKTVADVERWAQAQPGDWRINIESAMSERLYQRQEQGWVLVARGMGFA